MTPGHLVLALLVVVIWGLTFVATRLALDDFTPPQLTALRFLIAAVPSLFVPRPPLSWRVLIVIGLSLFTGQFLFQFFGMAGYVGIGLPLTDPETARRPTPASPGARVSPPTRPVRTARAPRPARPGG